MGNIYQIIELTISVKDHWDLAKIAPFFLGMNLQSRCRGMAWTDHQYADYSPKGFPLQDNNPRADGSRWCMQSNAGGGISSAQVCLTGTGGLEKIRMGQFGIQPLYLYVNVPTLIIHSDDLPEHERLIIGQLYGWMTSMTLVRISEVLKYLN